MTDNPQELVLRILISHRGQSKAIKGPEIARLLGLHTDRSVRQVIRLLIADGYPIASSVRPPLGYFIIENLAEAKDYQEGLRARLIEDALRLRDFKRSVGRLEKVVQCKLL